MAGVRLEKAPGQGSIRLHKDGLVVFVKRGTQIVRPALVLPAKNITILAAGFSLRKLWFRTMQNSWRRSVLVLALLIAAIQTPTTRTQTGVRPSPPQAVFHPDKLVEMDAAIREAVADHQCPGVVLWLERNGVAYHKAYGKRALAPAEEPMTEDTIFDAASLTKVVACAPAVMLLVERGRIELEERVQT